MRRQLSQPVRIGCIDISVGYPICRGRCLGKPALPQRWKKLCVCPLSALLTHQHIISYLRHASIFARQLVDRVISYWSSLLLLLVNLTRSVNTYFSLPSRNPFVYSIDDLPPKLFLCWPRILPPGWYLHHVFQCFDNPASTDATYQVRWKRKLSWLYEAVFTVFFFHTLPAGVDVFAIVTQIHALCFWGAEACMDSVYFVLRCHLLPVLPSQFVRVPASGNHFCCC